MPTASTARRIAAVVAPVATAATLLFAPAASADVTCTKVAAPSGSDSAAGTLDAPYRTAKKLVDSLSAGNTGCLRAGTYVEDVRIGRGGSAGAPLTLASYPGERAKVVGRLYVPKGSNYVTVANLDLNGTPEQGTNDGDEPSPTLNAENITFTGNDVTNDHHAICFLLGNSWGAVKNVVLDGNRIHDCGQLPATNYDHGIYVEISTNARIVNNLIYDNSDRGIQLYHDAQDTLVSNNVIDGNGEGVIFSGDYGYTSNNNVVEDNIITNSKQRNNVESWYPDGNPVGKGNVVRDNCIAGGARDNGNGGISSEWGFNVESGNVIGKNPKFMDRGAKDFRLQPGSPCEGIANGATGSSAARSRGNDAPAPTPTTTTPEPSSHPNRPTGPAVSLRTKRTRRGHVRLRGRVRRGLILRSASAAPTRAVVQLRWAGAWYPLQTLRLRGAKFDSQLRIPSFMRGRVLKLRVVVPKVGKSSTVRVRAR